jgi:hypothetical protein
MRRIVYFAASIVSSVAVWAQAQPPQVLPVPIPGGDVVGSVPLVTTPAGFINQFFPGIGPIYDGQNAEPHGITNFRGVTAMGYTLGPATDSTGAAYQVITDIRVYKGDYIGAQATFPAGGSTSAKAHGTFVEI